MTKVFNFETVSKKNLLSGTSALGEVFRIYPGKNDEKTFVVVRLEHLILGFEYEKSSRDFVFRWKKEIKSDGGAEADKSYPVWIYDLDNDDVDEVILREKDGLKILDIDGKLLGKSEVFQDLYGKKQIGAIGKFYPSEKHVGLMHRTKNNENKFKLFDSECLGESDCDILKNLPQNFELPGAWNNPAMNVNLADLEIGNTQTTFVLRSQTGLEFYQFNKKMTIEKSITGFSIGKSLGPKIDGEQFYFGSFSNKKYQDILQTNTKGINLYKYNENLDDYELLHHDPMDLKSLLVDDLDNDGKSELIFNDDDGISVLTFNAEKKLWENSTGLKIGGDKFAKIVGTMKVDGQSVALVQSSDGSLKHGQFSTGITRVVNPIKKLSNPISEKPRPSDDSISIFEITQVESSPIATSMDLRWTEQWTKKFEDKLSEKLPNSDGNVAFSVPLTDLSLSQYLKVQLVMSYNDQQESTGDLGVGWNIPLLNNHISADYHCSVFLEDSVFTLFGFGKKVELKRDVFKEAEASHVVKFSVADQPDMEVSYVRNKNSYWEIETPTEKLIYGEDARNGAVQMNLSSEKSRCSSVDMKNIKKLPITWFLKERQDKTVNKSIFYSYKTVKKPIVPGGETYTHSVQLKSINDGKDNLVTIDYAIKTPMEISSFDVVENGKVVFPIPLSEESFISKITVNSEKYKQIFNFNYKVNKGVRWFIGFDQALPGHSVENILKMDYLKLNGKDFLKQLTLPRGSTIAFEYSSLDRQIPQNSLIKTFPVDNEPLITSGADYKVISYTRGAKIYLRISKGIDNDVNMEFPTGVSSFRYQAFAATRQMFFILIASESGKRIVVFRKIKDKWLNGKVEHEIGKDVNLCFGEKFVAFPEGEKVKILDWIDDESLSFAVETLDSPNRQPLIHMKAHGRIIAGYDDDRLVILYRGKRGWEGKKLQQIAGFDASTRQFINNFDISDDLRKDLTTFVLENLLQINKNQIVLKKIEESNGKFFVSLSLITVDADYAALEHVEKVERDDFANVKLERQSEKMTFTLKYTKVNGKYSASVHDVTSSDQNSNLNLGSASQRKNTKSEFIKQINKDKSSQESFKKSFLIDWKKYHTQLSPVGVIVGDDVVFEMTGTNWEKKTPKQSSPTFKLGPKLEFEQKDSKVNQMEFYEINGAERKLALEMKVEGEYVNLFPLYFAYQATMADVNVVSFTAEKTLGPVRTIKNAKLLYGDYNGLTMLANSTSLAHSEPREFKILPLAEIIPSQLDTFVSKKTSTSVNLKRITSYKRTFEVDDEGNLKETYTLIPGGEKEKFGWYEEIRSINGTDKTVTKERKIFHADGKLKTISVVETEAKNVMKKSKKKAKTDFSMKIMDKSKVFEISDINPQKFKDGNIAYYGFESYENKLISTEHETSWDFPDDILVRNQFSLTGENFLRLDGDIFEGKIQPKNQKETFVASCWVRSNDFLWAGQPSSILVVELTNTLDEVFETIPATVMHQIGEWVYLEVIVNFAENDEKYKKFLESQEPTETKSNKRKKPSKKPTRPRLSKNQQYKAVLRVKPENDLPVDLDNIRFYPISHDLNVKVFNPSGQITEEIFPSGIIKKKIYNKYGNEIASINQEGSLEEIKAGSETGKLMITTLTRGQGTFLSFKASENKLYNAAEWWKMWKIDSHQKKNDWTFAPGQIRHHSNTPNKIIVPSSQLNMNSMMMRFDYALNSAESILSFKVNEQEVLKLHKINKEPRLSVYNNTLGIQPYGEVILTIENSRVVAWIDGVLIADFGSTVVFNDDDSLEIEMTDSVVVENFMSLNNPIITVEYFNMWGEPTQIINMESENVAQVSETLHDALGRRSITTKATRITRTRDQSLIAFYGDFVTNDQYDDPQSVWTSHLLRGDASKLNPKCRGFPYKRTEFELNPSKDKKAIGLPGKDFSITGPYSKKVKSVADIPFLLNLFPVSKGFTMYTTVNENGSQKVTVFDGNEKKVAVYVRVTGSDNILSINEYDDQGRIVKILPPTYHKKVGTARREVEWKFGDEHLKPEEKELQKAFGSHFAYDEVGNLIRKSTPDNGNVEFVYDKNENRRFMKLHDGKTVYFLYDDVDNLIETGHLNDELDVEELKNLANSSKLPDSYKKEVLQEFSFNEDFEDPLARKATKKFTTNYGPAKITEELVFDSMDRVTARSTTLPKQQAMKIEKTYEADKLSTLTYPKEENDEGLKLVFKYNKRGLLASIINSNDSTTFAEFTYDPDGQIESEKIQPNSKHEFTRRYQYQTAGFLEKIDDPFLKEEMTYTSDGYGQKGFGDGILSSTTFQASWAEKANPNLFKANLNDWTGDKQIFNRCSNILKQAGYLSATNVVEKSLNFENEPKLPVECKGKVGFQMSKLIAKKQIPKVYGHRYAYGNHQELIKAKYFTDEKSMKAEPLQADSFSKDLSDFTIEESHDVWKILTSGKFLTTDQRNSDIEFAVGKPGIESIVRVKEIEAALSSLASPTFNALQIAPEIVNLILRTIHQKQFFTAESFEKDFLGFYGLNTASTDWQIESVKKNAAKVFEKLSEESLLQKNPRLFTPLNPKLVQGLKPHFRRIPDIINVLSSHFANAIGESPFDLYSYNIDANGNHRLFYNGFERFEINYQGDSNKISNIKLDDITSTTPQASFAVKHDANGNIVKALHRNIEEIEYFTTSQRTKKILMTDGRVIKFFYDVAGERILKQVLGSRGQLTSSTKYIRDEKGKVLVDKKTIFNVAPKPHQVLITKYIYGPRGLIGFVRNGEFLSVTTDHAGSIRLVIRNGEVVASYDYLPYGDLMRKFVKNSAYEIDYRFTGQEIDEETGLYNYHARFYDPSIGRFYQIDPLAQYFSPYLYSGNSPISFVDPDGQFAFLIVVGVLAIAGAYIGGASANNSWNPAKWNWEDKNTYAAIGFGAFAGATLPYSAVALGVAGSLVAGGVGVVGGYLGGSAANKKFNPLEWDWKSPETIGGLFNGFTAGFNIAFGISGINASLGKSMNLFISANKNTFTAVAVAGAFGYGYQEGVDVNDGNVWFWEWNYSEDNIAVTLGAIFSGFSTGISVVGGLVKPGSSQVKDGASKPAVNWHQHLSQDIKQLIAKLPPKTAAIMVGAISTYYAVGGDEIMNIFDFKNFDHQKIASGVAFLEMFLENRHNYLQSLELQKSLAIARKAIKEEEETLIAEEEKAERDNDEKVSQDEFFVSDESSRNRRQTRSILWNPREITSFQGFPSVVENNSSSNFNSSSFNVLDMGDKWMQQTETIGNLTLLNLLMDKLFNSSKSKAKNDKKSEKSDIECQILSAEVVNEFAEKFVELAEECGISEYLANEIIEKVVNLTNLTRKVKTEIRRKDFEQVLKLLRAEIAKKSLNFLKNKVTNNQIAQLQEKLNVELIKVQGKLEKSE